MLQYANKSGKSGIDSYEIGKDYIIVGYKDGYSYLYNYEEPGKSDVDIMKELATEGIGLATYISRYVGKRYAAKF